MTSKYEALAAKYPDFFIFPECGEGWYEIISEVCRIAEARIKNSTVKVFGSIVVSALPEFKFTQIKEKFGGLRMYFDGGDDYISGAVKTAESVSFRTCEVTGNPGALCKKGGWLKTLCPEQAEILGFTPLKEKNERGDDT